jgi:hypothetical protein
MHWREETLKVNKSTITTYRVHSHHDRVGPSVHHIGSGLCLVDRTGFALYIRFRSYAMLETEAGLKFVPERKHHLDDHNHRFENHLHNSLLPAQTLEGFQRSL